MKRILASLAVILGIALLLSTDRRATRLRVVGSAFALQAAPACAASVPADLAKRPARWLGGCAGGKAEGLGVLRLGTAEPFQFFTGTMKAGNKGSAAYYQRMADHYREPPFE